MKETFSAAYNVEVETEHVLDEKEMGIIAQAISEAVTEHRSRYLSLSNVTDIAVAGVAHT